MWTGTAADVFEEVAALCRVKMGPCSSVDKNQPFRVSCFVYHGMIAQFGNQVRMFHSNLLPPSSWYSKVQFCQNCDFSVYASLSCDLELKQMLGESDR